MTNSPTTGERQGGLQPFRLPVVFGIVNVTRDSFSDGGQFLNAEAAIEQGRKLVAQGAHVIDLGAAASNPNAEVVPVEVEIARLAPVVAALKQNSIALSIDTFAGDVQRWALEQGVEYVNDIHGFAEPKLYPVLADSSAKLVVMHAVQDRGKATAIDVPPGVIFQRVMDFFDQRVSALRRAGIAPSRLILDPGMGLFLGARIESSFEVLRRLPELKACFGLPILVSVSRKSFLRRTVRRGVAEAGFATLAAEIFALFRGADYIRTHDPAALADGAAVWATALTGNTTSS